MRTSFSLMPNSCNRRMVRLRCDRRAAALRSCVTVNCAAIVSARFREHRRPRIRKGTNVFVAVRSWAMVRPSFFPPVSQAELGQEQMTHAGQDQMPLNGNALANPKLIHAQVVLRVLEESLDAPSREGHQQQRLDWDSFRRVAQEELELVG